MEKEFDNKLIFDNVAYLIKNQNIKVGELESEIGVSAGYIARASKDITSKPSIDFIIKVCELLKVDINTLIKVDLSDLPEEEKYRINFLNKIIKDTKEYKIDWKKESKIELRALRPDINNNINHPLFSYEVPSEGEDYNYNKVVFKSNSFELNTDINSDCYCFRLKNHIYLYLMDIKKEEYGEMDPYIYAKEIWFTDCSAVSGFFLSDFDNKNYKVLLNELVSTINISLKNPKLPKKYQAIIDDYMYDKLEDDEDYCPF